MLRTILKFMFERFSPKVTIPLTFILVASAAKSCDLSNEEFILAWISAFWILFILRAVDDLSDIEVDKIYNPRRRLVSGQISQKKLKSILYLIGGLIICLNFKVNAIIFIMGLMLLYTFIFYYKDSLPGIFRVPLINIVFLFLPLYVGVTGYSTSWIPLILLGLFIWLSTIAHDIAHSIGDKNAGIDCSSGLLLNIGLQPAALLAATMFIAAAGMGFLFWWRIGQPFLFIILLSMTLSQIIYLSIKLIRNPVFASARPFYVYGFTFFLIPLIGLMLDNLLRMSIDL